MTIRVQDQKQQNYTFNAIPPDAIYDKKVTITRNACLIDYNNFYYLIKLKFHIFNDKRFLFG